MTGDQRKIRTAGARRVPDAEERLAALWADDAKAAQARIERQDKVGGHLASTNDVVNETQRIRNSGLTLHRRAKRQCSSCGKMRLPADLIAPVARGHYGSRVCSDNEGCAEKARKWARSSD